MSIPAAKVGLIFVISIFFNNESYKRQMTDNYLSQFVFVLKIAFFDILNFKLNYMSRVKNDACIYYKFLLKFPVDTYIGER